MIHVEKRLTIAGETVGLVEDTVTLELNGVGRGVFRARAEDSDTEIAVASFAAGFRGRGVVYPVLTGATVERVRESDEVQRVVVQDPASLLDTRADFALRHCTPRQVIAAIEARTGLRILLPGSGAYLARRLPYFYAEGSCRQALEGMGPAWGVADAVWLTLPDGRLWWGGWSDGPWPAEPLIIDARLVVERLPEARTVVLPYLPRLRPGVVLRVDGLDFLVQRVELAGDRARVSWGELS